MTNLQHELDAVGKAKSDLQTKLGLRARETREELQKYQDDANAALQKMEQDASSELLGLTEELKRLEGEERAIARLLKSAEQTGVERTEPDPEETTSEAPAPSPAPAVTDEVTQPPPPTGSDA